MSSGSPPPCTPCALAYRRAQAAPGSLSGSGSSVRRRLSRRALAGPLGPAPVAPGSPVRSPDAVRVQSSRRWSVLALVAALPALRPPLFVTPLAGVSPEQPSRRPEAGRHAACGGLTFPPYRSLRSLGGNGPGSRPNAVRGRGPAPAPSAQRESPPSQAVRRANGPPLRCGPSSRRTAWGLPRGGYRPRGRVLSVGSVGASPALASDTPTARRAPEHGGRRGRPPARRARWPGSHPVSLRSRRSPWPCFFL